MTFDLIPDGRAAWHLREPHWTWPHDAPEATALLTDGDVPVSVCRLFPRRLSSFDVSLDVCGVGGVYTHPDYRRRGHGTALLRQLSTHLWRGAKLALVLYAKDRGLYTRAGFTWLQPMKDHGNLLAKPLLEGLTFAADSRLASRPWQVWPEGRF